jgi:hypothetical protein
VTTTVIDPDLLLSAAHELGHALVDLAGGLVVSAVTLRKVTVTVELENDTDPAVWRAWLIGCVAGYEAERLWSRRHGGSVDRLCSRTDFKNFNRHRLRVRLSEHTARSQARTILRREWTTVERLAPELATHGHLPVDLVRKGR